MTQTYVEIFTDGACSGNPGPGGYGAILRCREKGIEKCYVNSFGWRRKFYNAAGFTTEDTVGFWYKTIGGL